MYTRHSQTSNQTCPSTWNSSAINDRSLATCCWNWEIVFLSPLDIAAVDEHVAALCAGCIAPDSAETAGR